MNHPSLILSLIEHAKSDIDYKVEKVFDDDTITELEPMDDFKNAYQPVDEEVRYGLQDDLKSAELGYERGYLRTLVDELAPESYNLPKDRFAKRCGPIACALTKLSGEEIRYDYAHNIKTVSYTHLTLPTICSV